MKQYPLLLVMLFTLAQCNQNSKQSAHTNQSSTAQTVLKDSVPNVKKPNLSEIPTDNLKFLVNMVNNMVFVEHGTMNIGVNSPVTSENFPEHEIHVNDFFVSKYELTQNEWQSVMFHNPSYFQAQTQTANGTKLKDCPNCPVENITWQAIEAFLKGLNDKTGLSFRLPTEEEWEFAARGGNKSKGYVFSGSNDPNEVAWSQNNSFVDLTVKKGIAEGARETHQVGLKKPNELGIYDMSGNVSELCSSFYTTNYSDKSKTEPFKNARIIRGGSFDCYNADGCQPSIRTHQFIENDGFGMYTGLRLALDNSAKDGIEALKIEYAKRLKMDSTGATKGDSQTTITSGGTTTNEPSANSAQRLTATSTVKQGATLKVISDKAYFYAKPDESLKKKSYLVTDEQVTVQEVKGDFIYVEFTNKEGKVTKGWMKMKEFGDLSGKYNF